MWTKKIFQLLDPTFEVSFYLFILQTLAYFLCKTQPGKCQKDLLIWIINTTSNNLISLIISVLFY